MLQKPAYKSSGRVDFLENSRDNIIFLLQKVKLILLAAKDPDRTLFQTTKFLKLERNFAPHTSEMPV